MALVIPFADLQIGPTTSLFEGARHGDVEASCFITATPPGGGPSLHVHPYAEVFVVLDGEARYTAGDEEVDVTGGHVVVVPPETPHKFVNTGDRPLRQVNIHPHREVVQRPG